MLEGSRIAAGRWEGLWTGAAEPNLKVTHQERELPGLACEALDGGLTLCPGPR